MQTIYTTWQAPLCKITVAADSVGITCLHLNTGQPIIKFVPQSDWSLQPAAPLLQEAVRQLDEYFLQRRSCFSLPLHPAGTEFQKLVWQALQTIPYGETRSYKQIAEQIGRPKAARAIGMANNKNPIALLIPCHRVIGASGKMTGFAAGIEIKQKLLEMEAGIGEYGKSSPPMGISP